MGGMPGMGGGGGMPAGMDEIMKDPEIMAAMANPKVMAAVQSCMGNPMQMMQYMNDPEVGPVLQKMMGKMMGGGMPPGAMGGMPGGMGGVPGGMPAAASDGPSIVEDDEPAGASIEEVD